MQTRPNFLVLGPMKTGSTSLHYYLGQHPDVFICPVKEPAFFAYEGKPDHPSVKQMPSIRTRLEDYEALFAGVSGETAVGEVSPQYLEHAVPEVIGRIKRYLDSPRLMGIIRHPLDRAYSLFNMHVRSGLRPGDSDFATIIRRELDCRARGLGPDDPAIELAYSIADRAQLYVEAFPRGQLAFLPYDVLHADSAAFMRRVFTFLGVDPDHPIDTSFRLNRAGRHRTRTLTALLEKPNPVRFAARSLLPERLRVRARHVLEARNRAPVARLDPDLRRELSGGFRDEIERLQDLVDRDLSHWSD